ncbi:AtpZ/AtpI family protein [Pseudobutyrivibrio sp.]|uniref:AtpZ/AtpI family protein n=1 Tax=Pseudobutyrivibrio sp. TaxID=2014367 RepID=UPI001B6D66D5|nr:AtpZ/AtpI family protein [Pseudobutyrivibrio sp.]MBP5597627.1 AtpZ/AtpI family protein [Pseudobutyrivibrio sp.]MBR5648175.1 AtpZ/AtpI family protein [Pseudobutyrivibrio sp.]
MKDKRKQNREVANSLVLVLQFGLNVITPILLCTIVGAVLTKNFGSKGYTIAGILIGIVAAFNGAYRMVRGYLKNPESPGERARRLEEEAKQSQEVKDD